MSRLEMLLARLRYMRDRTRRRWRIITLRCPCCPKRIRGPHKLGCSRHGRSQVIISMRKTE